MSDAPAPPAADWEEALNPRLSVPDAAALMAAWPLRAAAARSRHDVAAGRAYGPHPREIYDVIRPENPRGAVLFIHGGYWRSFAKDDFTWVADGLVPHGYTTIVLNYPLCPEVRVTDIAASTRRAFAHLHRHELGDAERANLLVTGHSAGGYLTAALLATDWSAAGLPADPIRGAMPISGVFRPAGLIHTSINAAVRLDAEEAAALALGDKPPLSRAKLTLVVGGDESAEFHRQSERLAADWAALHPRLVDAAGLNHFTVVDGLADSGSALVADLLALGA
jgi:arylformamidase